MKEENRIAWIDIYKCLVIILVVLGHSTGVFNKYIYQFHMAAFFFISGYTSHLEKKSMATVLVNKFFTLFLPVFTFLLVGLAFIKLLSVTKYSGILFPTDGLGMLKAVKLFFHNGSIYVQFLGACWFIMTLFGIFLLHKLILMLCGNRYNITYIIATIIVYTFGYYLVSKGIFTRWGFDLVCIGQMFFAVGCIAAQIEKTVWKTTLKYKIQIAVFLGNLLIFWYMCDVRHITVDYPSRVFNNILLDLLAASNGILFIYNISTVLEMIPQRGQKLLSYIGRNTMGIMFFHFLCFKLCFVIFYKSGIMQLEEVAAVVPPMEVGNRYWPLITAVALIGSLTLWEICRNIPVFRFLLGFQKTAYQEIYRKMQESVFGEILDSVVKRITSFEKKIQDYIVRCFRQNPYVMISVMFLIVEVVFLLYKQGVTVNDELQDRFWSYQGFRVFWEHYISELVLKGRAMSIPVKILAHYLGFLGQRNWTFKLLQIFSILIVDALFGKLIYKLFQNKYFAYFCGISGILFLPITFEHTAPQAFVVLYNIPFSLLLWSMLLFLDYLEEKSVRKLAFSVVFLLIAEMGYENFITFIPVYLMFVLYKCGCKKFLNMWKTYIWPIVSGVLFLMMYLISRIIFPSNYDGNRIAGINLKESLIVIKELFLAAFPGHWLMSPTYRYLYNIMKTDNPDSIVVLLVIGAAFVVCIAFMVEKLHNFSPKPISNFGVLICGVITVILPSLPLSMAKMYQGTVGENGFRALPTTFFSYFAAVFLCCYVIWQICSHISSKVLRQIIVVGMMLVFLQIQRMNIVFSDEQSQMFNRLVSIENAVKSDLLAEFEGETFYAGDFYKTKHSLGIHDGYWTSYAHASGRNITFVNGEVSDAKGNSRIYIDESDNAFLVWIENYLCVLSQEPLPAHMAVHYFGEEYLTADCTNAVLQNGWYMDYFCVEGNKLEKCTEELYLEQSVGSDLSTCKLGKGAWGDGWLESSSSFKIRTGQTGAICMKLYNPQDDGEGKTLSVYVNGEQKGTYSVLGGIQQIEVSAEPEQIVECTIETDYLQTITNGDSRELSFILSDLKGM